MFVIATFYQFTAIKNPDALRAKFKKFMLELDLKGSFLLSFEGINATIAGTKKAVDELGEFLKSEGFEQWEYKESFAQEVPFKRLKVHFKKEIVTLGVAVSQNTGTYVEPLQWNDLLRDPEVTCLDVRNDFEVQLGSFKNALNPRTKLFKDFPNFVRNNLDPSKNKKIAMSCTGGIRCEKASAFMKDLGFSEVYHLKGGILKYLEEVPKSDSLWQGDCFVFDERIAVDHDLKPQVYEKCPICHEPKLTELCSCIRNKK